MPSSRRERLLITVLTYPHPSKKYHETVCTAGITEEAKWIRLYPVPLRSLPPSQRLRKWQWVEVETQTATNDIRPESRRPNLDTITILERLDPERDRDVRRSLVDRLPHRTVNDLSAGYDLDHTSLGVVVPRRVIGLEVEADDQDWTSEQKTALSQLNLFADPPRKLERVPYRFRYRFEDQDGAQHRMTVRDWELGVLFLKMRDEHGEEEAIRKVGQKYLNQMCAPDKDTRFFVGTMYPYNRWMVVGVFWPPLRKPESPEAQPDLFAD